MRRGSGVWRSVFTTSFLILTVLVSTLPAAALGPKQSAARFDHLTVSRPGGVAGVSARRADDLPATDVLRQRFHGFSAGRGGGWKGWFDERSGLPLLVIGSDRDWLPGDGGPPLRVLEAKARALLAEHPDLLGRFGDELVVDEDASGSMGDRIWQLTLRQVVGGVPVDGARYDFHVVHGNLVAFGAARLAPVVVPTETSLTRDQARQALDDHLGPEGAAVAVDLEEPGLVLVPLDPRGLDGAAWNGPRGGGWMHRLVWRFTFEVPGELARWVAEIDAHTGDLVSFRDDARYERIKGGVYPAANDGDCADDGCQLPDFPMPFLDYSVNGGGTVFTEDHGVYTCSTIGDPVETTLTGQYVRVSDDCGSASETGTCENDLDLGLNPGTDCQVTGSAGNTRAGRTSYYHLNIVKQKGRYWLPSRAWFFNQLNDRVNINANCNAVYNGSTNFFTSGGGCNNTGENPSVVNHELGHGIDANDGGGFDNTSEGYADVIAFFENRESCIGRGFRQSGNCSGYGDTCLDCSGIRDVDWDKRVTHTPATPSGFLSTYCPNGGGPCGKESHCEGYVGAEAVWDLATRDLPAMGLDADSSWQLAERLWYVSRLGSGGDAYNCSLPNSDGCVTTSWYHKMRLADDDDGDLDNGTPHAEAIFAAFDRHGIACDTQQFGSNTSSSSCPTLAQPVLTTTTGLTESSRLDWNAVTDADVYRILRTDLGCDNGQVVVGEVSAPATTYLDDDLSNGFPVYYRIQAVGTNSACESAVSSCVQVVPQPLAGKIRFDQPDYGCSNRIGLRVQDANAGAATVMVTVRSDTETTPETVVLTETSPGSDTYVGEIYTTTTAPAADGQLTVTEGDTLTAEYTDADDGDGGVNIVRDHLASTDCTFPQISNVQALDVTTSSARLTWTTDEASDTVALWDETAPPATTATGENRVTSHEIQLSGLQSCTTHYFEVQSTDTAGNTAADDNAGAFFKFETLGDFGAGPQVCHAGQVLIDQVAPSCSETVTFRVIDIDLNQDPGVAETTLLRLTSTTETTPEIVVATEMGVNSSIFSGSIATAGGAAAPDGLLQTSDGDVLTVIYDDADDGSGSPGISFATSTLDCSGPQISNIRVEAITNARVTVSWDTDEPASSLVQWGETAALGQSGSSSALVTSHGIVLNQFDLCGDGYFTVSSTDAQGNTAQVDNQGAPFVFTTHDIPGLYWMDDFESGNQGWTLGGEWEIGAPQGLGGSTGLADPPAAYNNAAVLGHDLSGLGSFGGDYEANVNETATSPTLGASTWTDTRLIVHRKLNVDQTDTSSLVFSRNGIINITLFENTGAVADGDFVVDTYDVSSLADGAPAVFLVFGQTSDGSAQRSGWNVDDVILKDGTLPDYAACGGCAAGPSFAGAVSAVDNDACGATGVTVSWAGAVAWGSGGAGTYSLYRDGTPGFTPSASNRIASGIAGLSFNDATAPTDQSLYYVVRAENDETCSTGPANGGVMDGNVAEVAVQETTGVPVPGAFDSLTVDLIGDAHVRLDWGVVPDAVGYRVYRSDSPSVGFVQQTETPEMLYEDLGEGVTPDTFFYTVVGINACGQEGP